MDFPGAAAAIAAAQDQLKAEAELSQTAKGQLQLGLAGAPISITPTQLIFALAMRVTPEHSLNDFAHACEELVAEGAITSYRLVVHANREYPDGSIAFEHPLDTPVVLAVRRRSAESTRIGPAAL